MCGYSFLHPENDLEPVYKARNENKPGYKPLNTIDHDVWPSELKLDNPAGILNLKCVDDWKYIESFKDFGFLYIYSLTTNTISNAEEICHKINFPREPRMYTMTRAQDDKYISLVKTSTEKRDRLQGDIDRECNLDSDFFHDSYNKTML